MSTTYKRKFDERDVDYTIAVYPEDLSVRGNVLASGDDDEDREAEDRVLAALEHNEWAWCVVKVTASWGGLKGSDYLGGCSYESREDFEHDGYFEDMKACALNDLRSTLEREGWTDEDETA